MVGTVRLLELYLKRTWPFPTPTGANRSRNSLQFAMAVAGDTLLSTA